MVCRKKKRIIELNSSIVAINNYTAEINILFFSLCPAALTSMSEPRGPKTRLDTVVRLAPA